MKMVLSFFCILLTSTICFAQAGSDYYSTRLVKNVLDQPTGFSDSFTEKQINRLGDKISIALMKIFTEEELNNPQTVKKLLPIIKAAFLAPQIISIPEDKKPKVTMVLLHKLEKGSRNRKLRKEISDLEEYVLRQTGKT